MNDEFIKKIANDYECSEEAAAAFIDELNYQGLEITPLIYANLFVINGSFENVLSSLGEDEDSNTSHYYFNYENTWFVIHENGLMQ